MRSKTWVSDSNLAFSALACSSLASSSASSRLAAPIILLNTSASDVNFAISAWFASLSADNLEIS